MCGVQACLNPKWSDVGYTKLRGRYSVVAVSVRLVKCDKATQFYGNVSNVLQVPAL